MEEVNYKFNCKSCNYNTNRIYRFKRHNLSSKHIYIKNGIISNNKSFSCACGKQYMGRQGLNRHKKTCDYVDTSKDDIEEIAMKCENVIIENQEDDIGENQEDDTDYKSMFISMVKDNNKIVNLLAEMMPKIGNNNNNTNSHNTTNNNRFNINVFLNDKCKDAMSMATFIEGATVSLRNLEITREKGFVEGVTSIFMDNLNKLDIHERPIHCSDLKRNTIYINNDGKWEKDEDRKGFAKAIGTMCYKQVQGIRIWTDENPNYKKSSSNTSDKYVLLIQNCMQCPIDNEKKIMKSVSKSILMPTGFSLVFFW